MFSKTHMSHVICETIRLPRDSILTWLLKDKLNGNCQTVMLATISPSGRHYSQWGPGQMSNGKWNWSLSVFYDIRIPGVGM